MMDSKNLNRREFLRMFAVTAAGVTLAACQPKVVEKVVKETVEVVKEVEVEKVVKETVVVEKEVEKVVTKIVVKEVEKKAPVGPVEVRFHGRVGTQGEWYQKWADKFNASQEEIKVKCENFPGREFHQKIQILAAGGTVGDAIWETSAVHFYSFAAKGLYADHTPIIDKENYDMAQFSESSVKDPGGVTVAGKIYGLPWLANPGAAGLLYNKKLFDEAGVAYPQEGWSYGDLLDAALKLTKRDSSGRTTQFGFLSSTECYHICNQWKAWGGDWLSADRTKATLDSPECIAATQWVGDTVNKHKVAPAPGQIEGGTSASFGSNKLAMFLEYYGSVSYGPTLYKDIDWAVAPTPNGPANTKGNTTFFDPVSIMAQSKHPEETFQYLKFICSKEAGIDLALVGGYPGSRPDVWESKELTSKQYHDVFAQAMKVGIPMSYPANYRLWDLYLETAAGLQKLMTGDEPDAAKVIAELNPRMQKIVDKGIM